MRACVFVLGLIMSSAATATFAHGPQIQTTLTGGKIVTRKIVDAASYATSLTNPISVYVMPLVDTAGIWRAAPDNSFVGWPGFAYGYGYDATNNPAPFPLGSNFTLEFQAGLKSWNGASFTDAGAAQAEAYRGTSASPTAAARTTDDGPFAGMAFPGGSGLAFANASVHSTINYQMLGDGSSIFSPVADGIYLLSFQLSNSDASVADSDTFYFVLNKDSGPGALAAAIGSLGLAPERVQIVPEPTAAWLAATGLASLLGHPFTRPSRGEKA